LWEIDRCERVGEEREVERIWRERDEKRNGKKLNQEGGRY
jgi:hypothetical protein